MCARACCLNSLQSVSGSLVHVNRRHRRGRRHWKHREVGGGKKRGCGGKKEAVHDGEQRLKGKRGLRLEEGKAGLRRSGSEVRGWGY